MQISPYILWPAVEVDGWSIPYMALNLTPGTMLFLGLNMVFSLLLFKITQSISVRLSSGNGLLNPDLNFTSLILNFISNITLFWSASSSLPCWTVNGWTSCLPAVHAFSRSSGLYLCFWWPWPPRNVYHKPLERAEWLTVQRSFRKSFQRQRTHQGQERWMHRKHSSKMSCSYMDSTSLSAWREKRYYS